LLSSVHSAQVSTATIKQGKKDTTAASRSATSDNVKNNRYQAVK